MWMFLGLMTKYNAWIFDNHGVHFLVRSAQCTKTRQNMLRNMSYNQSQDIRGYQGVILTHPFIL